MGDLRSRCSQAKCLLPEDAKLPADQRVQTQQSRVQKFHQLFLLSQHQQALATWAENPQKKRFKLINSWIEPRKLYVRNCKQPNDIFKFIVKAYPFECLPSSITQCPGGCLKQKIDAMQAFVDTCKSEQLERAATMAELREVTIEMGAHHRAAILELLASFEVHNDQSTSGNLSGIAPEKFLEKAYLVDNIRKAVEVLPKLGEGEKAAAVVSAMAELRRMTLELNDQQLGTVARIFQNVGKNGPKHHTLDADMFRAVDDYFAVHEKAMMAQLAAIEAVAKKASLKCDQSLDAPNSKQPACSAQADTVDRSTKMDAGGQPKRQSKKQFKMKEKLREKVSKLDKVDLIEPVAKLSISDAVKLDSKVQDADVSIKQSKKKRHAKQQQSTTKIAGLAKVENASTDLAIEMTPVIPKELSPERSVAGVKKDKSIHQMQPVIKAPVTSSAKPAEFKPESAKFKNIPAQKQNPKNVAFHSKQDKSHHQTKPFQFSKGRYFKKTPSSTAASNNQINTKWDIVIDHFVAEPQFSSKSQIRNCTPKSTNASNKFPELTIADQQVSFIPPNVQTNQQTSSSYPAVNSWANIVSSGPSSQPKQIGVFKSEKDKDDMHKNVAMSTEKSDTLPEPTTLADCNYWDILRYSMCDELAAMKGIDVRDEFKLAALYIAHTVLYPRRNSFNFGLKANVTKVQERQFQQNLAQLLSVRMMFNFAAPLYYQKERLIEIGNGRADVSIFMAAQQAGIEHTKLTLNIKPFLVGIDPKRVDVCYLEANCVKHSQCTELTFKH